MLTIRPLRDPRHYQIAVLSGLLAYGVTALDFEIDGRRAALILVTALLAQFACRRIWNLPRFDARSALISALSLCLLLRANSAVLVMVTTVVTITSKFVLRVGNKHVFNPTNLGLVVMMLATGGVWVSPGQWGNAAFFAFLIAGLGGLVVNRAGRSDVTLTFLAIYGGLVFARSMWLGEPLAIPLHRLENGALLLFAFFMLSDPKTTPDSRPGRIVFAALVALGGAYVQFKLFRTNGLLWSLAGCSFLVPLIDRLSPARRYDWTASLTPPSRKEAPHMKRVVLTATLVGLLVLADQPLRAFCGFYVCKADAALFNRASQVVLIRDGNRTVLTMANDFKGDPKEFAIVIPVPTRIEREQIHIGDKALIDHLDAYSAPRLVEYFDEDPCARMADEAAPVAALAMEAVAQSPAVRSRSLGVTIEAQYTVGEYDIVILSATQSTGLETWLRGNGYRTPEGAAAVLASYIRQNMRFFVAKVNVKEQGKLGFSYLRPIQVAYESPKFMLPIRLGMVNANGPQELFVYALTRGGRVEATNYRTVKLPSGMDLPPFVKQEFPAFYRAMFAEEVRKEDMRTLFTEYAWDMGWCDPCAGDPLSREELRSLGVFWLDDQPGFPLPGFRRGPGNSPAPNVFMTRLHVRYDNAHFPEDLVFQETGDRENYQARYVLRHPWSGTDSCEAATRYHRELRPRQEREAQTLASLTGWTVGDIRKKMGVPTGAGAVNSNEVWWQRLWKR